MLASMRPLFRKLIEKFISKINIHIYTISGNFDPVLCFLLFCICFS